MPLLFKNATLPHPSHVAEPRLDLLSARIRFERQLVHTCTHMHRFQSTHVSNACLNAYSDQDFACKSKGGYIMHDANEIPKDSDPITCVEDCRTVKAHMSPALMFGRASPADGPFDMEVVEPINSVVSERRADRPRGCYFVRCVHALATVSLRAWLL